jgi:exodeoxyribonuclease VII small subunit
MATNASDEFGKSLGRLEEIVAKLEQGSLSLDESVALFREGKTLAQRCEQLLKEAQTAIESAASGAAPQPAGRPAPVRLFDRADNEDHEELSL